MNADRNDRLKLPMNGDGNYSHRGHRDHRGNGIVSPSAEEWIDSAYRRAMSSLSSDQPAALSDFTFCHEAAGKTCSELNLAVGYAAAVVHRARMMQAKKKYRREDSVMERVYITADSAAQPA